MSESTGRGEPTDPVEGTYDREHGTATLKETEKPSGLTEAGNKGPATPAGEPFKGLKSY